MKRTRGAAKRTGSLTCVGVGITLGSHLTPLARSCIEQADIVFVAVSDAVVERWLMQMHRDVRSLQPLYAAGKPRRKTYREMVDALLAEVRAGRNVCAAFYGHPGVFAWSPHEAIRIARREGFRAHMEPGISAEDCLYADLGIDPGASGCQHYEASQLLFHRRRIDPSACLIIWQAGVLGDPSARAATAEAAGLRLLRDRLARDYAPGHRLIVYRAATLPIHAPRIERIALRRLADARIEAADTLVVPPARKPTPASGVRRRLVAVERKRR